MICFLKLKRIYKTLELYKNKINLGKKVKILIMLNINQEEIDNILQN